MQPSHPNRWPPLEQIVDRNPLKVAPDTSVLDTIALMSQNQTGCALVVEEARLVGRFAESDVVRLAASGMDLARMIMADVMARSLVTIASTETNAALTALSLLRQHRICYLPVVDEQEQLVGLVTQATLLQVFDRFTLASNADTSDRKAIEAALRESERRYISLAEASPVGIFRFDSMGQCVYVNHRWCEMTDRPSEAGMGMEWLQTIHPDDRDRTIRGWNQWFQDRGQPFRHEARILRPDGSILWFYCQILPEMDASGSLTGYVGSLTDISDRKYVEDSLRESEEKFRQFANHAEIVLWIAGVDSLEALYVSPAYETIWGRSCQSLYDRPISWLEAVHPSDRDRVEERTIQKQGGKSLDKEYRIVRPDGSIRWIWDRGFPIRDRDGKIVSYGGIAQDISDRKQAEQIIREQAALIDIVTDAIFVRDFENRILFWSQGAERLYGWTKAEALGKKIPELLYQGLPPEFEAASNTTLEKGSWQGELEKVTKTGKKIVVASSWTLVRNEAGQPRFILTVNTDITEKKRLEAQFYRAQRLESLGTLSSGIAHDLNNILTPILAISQLLQLKSPNLGEQTRDLLETLEFSARRGAEIVKQVLSFARGSEGKRIPLDVAHIITEILRISKETFPKSIEISVNMPEQNLWLVCADATQLHQVFVNLTINARDAMPNGGCLTLSVENFAADESFARMNLEAREGRYVAVTVTDTGTGIPPERMERIFDPFFTTKEIGRGTGLGLTAVQGIVKNHDGFIQVYSEVGKGSQFTVYLPADGGTLCQPPLEEELPPGNGEAILVVDDEETVREIAKATLEAYNYRVFLANDGIEAISLYADRKAEISAVLIDFTMPNLDGLTAIRTLKKINPQVKIIATSGLPANRQPALSLGIETFVLKPYTIKELLSALRAVFL